MRHRRGQGRKDRQGITGKKEGTGGKLGQGKGKEELKWTEDERGKEGVERKGRHVTRRKGRRKEKG